MNRRRGCNLGGIVQVVLCVLLCSISNGFLTDSRPLACKGHHSERCQHLRILSNSFLSSNNVNKKKKEPQKNRQQELAEAKVAVLEDVVRQIKAERETMRTQIQTLEAESLKSEASKHRSDAKFLELETKWSAEEASLKEQLEEQTSTVLRLKNQVEQQQSSLSQQEGSAKEQQIQQLEKIDKLQQQVKDLDISLSDASQEIVTLRQASETREMELQSAVEAEQRKHISMQKDLDRLLQKEQVLLGKAQNKTETYEESMQIASAAVAAAEAREQTVQATLQSIQAQMDTLNMTIQQQKQHIGRLQAEKKALFAEKKQEQQVLLLEIERKQKEAIEMERTAAAVAAAKVEASNREKEDMLLRQVKELEEQLKSIQIQSSATKEAEKEQQEKVDRRPGLWKRFKRKVLRRPRS